MAAEKSEEVSTSATQKAETEIKEECVENSVEPLEDAWAWMVALAAWSILIAVSLPIPVFGIIYSEVFLNRADPVSAATSGSVYALHAFMWMISSMYASTLCTLFGWRKVAFFGNFLSGSAIAISAFATEPWQLFILYSVFFGKGIGIIIPTCTFVLASYFKKRRGFVLSMLMVFSGLNFFFSPLLTTFLRHSFGSRGAIYVMGAMMLNGCVGSMLFVPIQRKDNGKNQQGIADTYKQSSNNIDTCSVGDSGYVVTDSSSEVEEVTEKESESSKMTDLNTPNKKLISIGERKRSNTFSIAMENRLFGNTAKSLGSNIKRHNSPHNSLFESGSTYCSQNFGKPMYLDNSHIKYFLQQASRVHSEPNVNSTRTQQNLSQIPNVLPSKENQVVGNIPKHLFELKKSPGTHETSAKVEDFLWNKKACATFLNNKNNSVFYSNPTLLKYKKDYEGNEELLDNKPSRTEAITCIKNESHFRNSKQKSDELSLNLSQELLFSDTQNDSHDLAKSSSIPNLKNNEVMVNENEPPKTFLTLMLDDMQLMRSHRVKIIAFAISFLMIAFANANLMVPFVMAEKGFDLDEASWAISISAICNILTRICVSFTVDHIQFSKRFIFMFGATSTSIGLFTFSLAKEWNLIIGSMSVFTLGAGCCIAVNAILGVEIMGLRLFPPTYSVTSIILSITLGAGGPILGAIKDQTKNYTLSLILMSFFALLAGFLYCLLPYASRSDKERNCAQSDDKI